MKKALSVFLAWALLLGVLTPFAAFAAQPEEPDEVTGVSADIVPLEGGASQSPEDQEEGAPEETAVIVTEAASHVSAQALASGSGAGNHTTASSGPKSPHTPKTYIWDMSRTYTLPQGNYSNYLQSLGILFPGDKVQILPTADENAGAHGYHGAPGIQLGGVDIAGEGEKIGPMRITQARSVGTPKDSDSRCKQYTYVTEITVEDAPVMLQVVGSGTGWATSNPGDNGVPQDSWGGVSVNYAVLPQYVPVQYIYSIKNLGNQTDYNGEFYGHDNPEVIWMEDISLTWNPESAAYEVIGPTFQIYRPFIESYSFVGWSWDSHSILSVRNQGDENLSNGQWESTTFYFEGIQTAFNTKFPNGTLWDGTTPVRIYFRFEQRYQSPETMALDANGGTINGYSRRLIDLENSKYFFGQSDFPASYLPTKENDTFTGWYADRACTKLIASADLTPAQMQSKLKSDSNNRYSPEYQYIQYLDDPSDVYWHYNLYAGWKSNQGQAGAVSLSNAAVSVAAQSYTGREQTPAVTVKLGTVTLKSGTDYTVSYQNNINPGTATVTVTGKGNYTGSVSKTFQINKGSQTLTVSAPSGLIVGKSAGLTVKGTGALTYTSGNTAVATVSGNGVVTAKAPGTVSITVKAAGNGNYHPATQTVRLTVSCAAPALAKAENVNGGVKLTWGKVNGAAKYRVFYKTGGGKWTKLADTTATSYLWKKAKSGTKYSFTVRCLSADGKSYTSAYNTRGKTLTYIAAPVLAKVQNAKNGVQVTWKKSAGAAKYRVFRKAGNGKWVKLGDTAKLAFVDQKVKKGVKYSYTVRCISKDGKSFTSGYNTKGLQILRK